MLEMIGSAAYREMQLQRLDAEYTKERQRQRLSLQDATEVTEGSTAEREVKEGLVREDSRSGFEGGYSSHTY